MSYLNELKPGKRENAFYKKTGLRRMGYTSNNLFRQQREIFVYTWDDKQKKHVGRLVNAEEYYSESR